MPFLQGFGHRARRFRCRRMDCLPCAMLQLFLAYAQEPQKCHAYDTYNPPAPSARRERQGTESPSSFRCLLPRGFQHGGIPFFILHPSSLRPFSIFLLPLLPCANTSIVGSKEVRTTFHFPLIHADGHTQGLASSFIFIIKFRFAP